MTVGILGYGVCIPRERIQSELLLKDREKGSPNLEKMVSRLKYGLLLNSKGIASIYDDPATMSYEAASNALRMSGISPIDIGIISVGTEEKPYAVKTIANQVGSWIKSGKNKYVFDLECACNSGITSIAIAKAFVGSNSVKLGLGIGADVPSAKEKDDLEYAVGPGAVAGVVGNGTEDELIGELYRSVSNSSDFTDFWRRNGAKHPRHFGPTSARSYIRHICGGIISLLKKYPQMTLEEFDYITPHQPNGYMPLKAFKSFVPEEIAKLKQKPESTLRPADQEMLMVAETLELCGIEDRARLTRDDLKNKLEPSLEIVKTIGNTYSAQTGIALSYILDRANPYQRILLASYGSGAQSIISPFLVLPGIENKRGLVPTVQDYIDRMVDVEIKNYKRLLKERVSRWGSKHLLSRKIVSKVEPSERNTGFHDISVCKDCGTIYTSTMRCLHADHPESQMINIRLPNIARILPEKDNPSKSRKRASNILLDGKVIMVDCSISDLEEGMEVEPVIKRVDQDGKEGLIHYSWAYRPLFRDSKQYRDQSSVLGIDLTSSA